MTSLRWRKHKRLIKNETKTKKRNWRYTKFYITTLKSTPGEYLTKSKV